jgi:cell division protein FtsW (lipid II flippase)
MREAVIVVVQVVISLVLVASLMPLVLVGVPWLREGRSGLVAVAALAVLLFVVLRLIWPRRVK